MTAHGVQPMRKVIVDTSVWVEYLRGKLDARSDQALRLLVESEQAIVTDLIRFELSAGARSPSEFAKVERLFSALLSLAISSSDQVQFRKFGFTLSRRGLLGRYTDTEIAFLSAARAAPIFSLDRYFHTLAKAGVISEFCPD